MPSVGGVCAPGLIWGRSVGSANSRTTCIPWRDSYVLCLRRLDVRAGDFARTRGIGGAVEWPGLISVGEEMRRESRLEYGWCAGRR